MSDLFPNRPISLTTGNRLAAAARLSSATTKREPALSVATSVEIVSDAEEIKRQLQHHKEMKRRVSLFFFI